jgi:hypothetical protein
LDALAPPQQVWPAFERPRSLIKRWVLFSRANGFAADYGHVDLCIGKHVKDDIYGALAEWVEEVEAPARHAHTQDRRTPPRFVSDDLGQIAPLPWTAD